MDSQIPQAAAVRAIAAQMALMGSSRADARDRLAGFISGDELREILDEVYGTGRGLTLPDLPAPAAPGDGQQALVRLATLARLPPP